MSDTTDNARWNVTDKNGTTWRVERNMDGSLSSLPAWIAGIPEQMAEAGLESITVEGVTFSTVEQDQFYKIPFKTVDGRAIFAKVLYLPKSSCFFDD